MTLDSSHTLTARFLDLTLDQFLVTPLYTNVFYHDNDLIHSDLRQSVIHVSDSPKAVAIKTTYVLPDADRLGTLRVGGSLGKVFVVVDDSLFLCLSLLNKIMDIFTPFLGSAPAVAPSSPTIRSAQPSSLFPLTSLLSPNSLNAAYRVAEGIPLQSREGVSSVQSREGVGLVQSREGVASVQNREGIPSVQNHEGIPSLQVTERIHSIQNQERTQPFQNQEGILSLPPVPTGPQTSDSPEHTSTPEEKVAAPKTHGYEDIEVQVVSEGVEVSMYKLLNSALFVKGRRDEQSLLFHFFFTSTLGFRKTPNSSVLSVSVNDASLEYGGKESSHVLLSKEASEMSGLDEDLDLVRVEIRNKDEINVDVNLLTVSVEPDSLMNVATSILNVVSCSPSDA